MTLVPLPKVAEELGPYTASGSITTAMLYRARRDGVITFGKDGMEQAELDRSRRECVCGADGCGYVTFGKSGYCEDHRGKGNAGKSVAAGTRRKQSGYRMRDGESDRRIAAMIALNEEVLADPERQAARIKQRQANRRRKIDADKAEKADAGQVVLEISEVAARVGRTGTTITQQLRRESAKPDPPEWAKPLTPSVKIAGRPLLYLTEKQTTDLEKSLAHHPDGRMQRFAGGTGSIDKRGDGSRDKRGYRDRRKPRRRRVVNQAEAERAYAIWCQAQGHIDPALSLDAAMATVRPIIKARRSVLRFHAGAPTKEELHARWADAYDEIAVWWRGRALDICLEIAKADYATAPERWKYDPAVEPERAKRKVDSAIRRSRARR